MQKSKNLRTMMIRRTIMSKEVELLFSHVPDLNATKEEYEAAVVDENRLGKVSMSARKLTIGYLRDLYSLDRSNPVFRAFKTFYFKGGCNRNLLVMQYAYLTDTVVQKSAEFFLKKEVGASITTEDTGKWVGDAYPSRFSAVSACSVAKNLNSSWFQAGYCVGCLNRKRVRPTVHLLNVAFAFYLAYKQGLCGMNLLDNEFVRLLELDSSSAASMAVSAAQQGLLVFHKINDVVEMSFPAFETKGVQR